MTDSAAIARVFERYGFRRGYSSDPTSHLVFTIRSGYFHQAEIVVLDQSAQGSLAETRRQLEATGFACHSRPFVSIADLEQRLFAGFFGVLDSQTRHRAHYEEFTKRVSRAIGGPYSYIAAPFQCDDQLSADASVVRTILEALDSSEPTLILIEAAAGFGKTCTAYEVLSALLKKQPDKPPLFIELARNRQAPLFRYVLLDEIDRNYPSLNSDLVVAEIQRGNVPLIVDGFDELLRRSLTGAASAEDHATVESMLDTIAALLSGAAQIILTTRRTAMFSAASFKQWADARPTTFRSLRISLDEPSVRDWLGPDRAARIAESGHVARALANPVLLSFLKNTSPPEFEAYVTDTDALVDRYFTSLLEREMERQDINIDHADQLRIYRDLAAAMITLDIMAEDRQMIAELIRDKSRTVLDASLRRYSPSVRPTLDQLSERLAGHALLDRVGAIDAQVGFVNEFVAGTLFGDAIVESPGLLCTDKVLDLATGSFRVRGQRARQKLFEALTSIFDALLPVERLDVSLRLLGRLCETLNGQTLESITFEHLTIGDTSRVEECLLIDCVFRSVRFDGRGILGTGFLNCRFYDCVVVSPCMQSWHHGSTWEPDPDALDALFTPTEPSAEVFSSLEDDLLLQFWPRGRSHASNRLSVRTLYRGLSPEEQRNVPSALASLRRAGLVRIEGDYTYLNMDEIATIRERLKR